MTHRWKSLRPSGGHVRSGIEGVLRGGTVAGGRDREVKHLLRDLSTHLRYGFDININTDAS